MPLQQTSGNVTSDAFGGGVAVEPNYIESVFSTYLYTGNQDVNAIANGIDLSTKGGMVWIKDRTTGGSFYDNALYDTSRGPRNAISSNLTAAQLTANSGREVTSFDTTGFTLGPSFNYSVNSIDEKYTSWTFRKQPKFFDVVTYTGNGTLGRTVAHSLGSVPGCIIVKRTDAVNVWAVWHKAALGGNADLYLNTTDAATADNGGIWGNGSTYIAPTATEFTVAANNTINASGGTYVAYIFAHDAGGFGLTGTDNVISCGTFNGADAAVPVTLGYEPQWLLVKRTDGVGTWRMFDNMRGMTADGRTAMLYANQSDAEIATNTNVYTPTATGFIAGSNIVTGTYIYIAIRRGPMKVPTDATKVFKPIAVSNTTGTVNTTGFPVDLQIQGYRPGGLGVEQTVVDRLRGASSTSTEKGARLITSATSAEFVASGLANSWNNTGFSTSSSWDSQSMAYWNFQRAPSFFDEVCYTGTGSYPFTINHNLGVVPELIIFKTRNSVDNWYVYAKPVTSPNANWYQNWSSLNSVIQFSSDTSSLTSSPTSTSIPVASYYAASGTTYVAYLFATCPGVSKVGSYTGNGTTQAIACGFAGGARFVLIKRTDSTGNWMTFDTSRGMTTLTDPFLSLNSTAAETATLGACTTTTGGFTVNEAILSGVNTNGGSYIYFSVA